MLMASAKATTAALVAAPRTGGWVTEICNVTGSAVTNASEILLVFGLTLR